MKFDTHFLDGKRYRKTSLKKRLLISLTVGVMAPMMGGPMTPGILARVLSIPMSAPLYLIKG